jgi:hypothetical protein
MTKRYYCFWFYSFLKGEVEKSKYNRYPLKRKSNKGIVPYQILKCLDVKKMAARGRKQKVSLLY